LPHDREPDDHGREPGIGAPMLHIRLLRERDSVRATFMMPVEPPFKRHRE